MLKKLLKNKDGKNDPSVIELPDFSQFDNESNEEAKVGKWLVSVGDYVNKGDLIAEISTNNFDLELEVYEDGHILFIEDTPNKILFPGDTLAIVGKLASDVNHLIGIEQRNEEDEVPEGELMPGYLGEVKLFAGNYIPENWAICDGKEFQVEDYPDLYRVLENKYGGIEKNTFNLPLVVAPLQLKYIICIQGIIPR